MSILGMNELKRRFKDLRSYIFSLCEFILVLLRPSLLKSENDSFEEVKFLISIEGFYLSNKPKFKCE